MGVERTVAPISRLFVVVAMSRLNYSEVNTMIADEELANALRNLLKLEVGGHFRMFGLLEIGQLENGNYWVSVMENLNKELFSIEDITLDEAIEHFIRIRKERQIGFDIEIDLIREGLEREQN